MHDCCGTFLLLQSGDLDDHFRRLQPNDLNLGLLGTSHLDNESKVSSNMAFGRFTQFLKNAFCTT